MKLVNLFLAVMAGVLLTGSAFAEDGGGMSVGAALAWGTGLIMAIAPAVGTFAQSQAAAAALEGIARNPQASDKIFTPLILCLALMESLVIFALIIAFMLQSKIMM